MKLLLAEVREAIDGAYAHCDLDEPKVFRIFRDVRFSKDKSPYKTHIGGFIPLARARQEGDRFADGALLPRRRDRDVRRRRALHDGAGVARALSRRRRRRQARARSSRTPRALSRRRAFAAGSHDAPEARAQGLRPGPSARRILEARRAWSSSSRRCRGAMLATPKLVAVARRRRARRPRRSWSGSSSRRRDGSIVAALVPGALALAIGAGRGSRRKRWRAGGRPGHAVGGRRGRRVGGTGGRRSCGWRRGIVVAQVVPCVGWWIDATRLEGVGRAWASRVVVDREPLGRRTRTTQ